MPYATQSPNKYIMEIRVFIGMIEMWECDFNVQIETEMYLA